MKLKVIVQRRGKVTELGPFTDEMEAIRTAKQATKGAATVVITREVEKDFHEQPDNVGKFFLHRIIK